MPKVVSLDAAPTTRLVYLSADDGAPETEYQGCIMIPVRDHVSAQTMMSLQYTDWSFTQVGKRVWPAIVQGGILTLQRNEAVQRMRGDWLLFIDDDMVWKPDDVRRLVEARDEVDADIMGALCYRRSEPHQPTLFMREYQDHGLYNFMEDWDSDIVEVDATGMAFVIIHKRVFEKIAGSPMPPYEKRIGGNPPNFFRWEGTLGEDLRFCQDAKAVGCRIFVDTRIEVGHMAEIEVRKKQFLLAALERDEETQRERKALNDRMGLPTLTREQAMEKLGWK